MARMPVWSVVTAAVFAMMSVGLQAHAQADASDPQSTQSPPATAEDQPGTDVYLEEVVVSGFRASLQEGIELKREAIGVRDSTTGCHR